MEFYTRVAAEQLPLLTHADKLVTMGSCFADRMGEVFHNAGFRILVNSHGVLFNPLSIAQCIEHAFDKAYAPNLCKQEERWVSLDYHGRLSGSTIAEARAKIVSANSSLCEYLTKAKWFILTWGTAWVYRTVAEGGVVANCHRFPAQEFKRELLSVGEIVSAYQLLLQQLRSINPSLKVLLTVSPVRHLRDGMLDNSVSKATLLLATQQLVNSAKEVYYFPSYEIMQDELRDYRFYEADLIQPNIVARKYIWERLIEVWFDGKTRGLVESIERYRKMCEHTPTQTSSSTWTDFLKRRTALLSQIELEIGYRLE